MEKEEEEKRKKEEEERIKKEEDERKRKIEESNGSVNCRYNNYNDEF